jgi:hypothetical protein
MIWGLQEELSSKSLFRMPRVAEEPPNKRDESRQAAQLAGLYPAQQAEYLGTVLAPDVTAAGAVAVKTFAPEGERRKRCRAGRVISESWKQFAAHATPPSTDRRRPS